MECSTEIPDRVEVARGEAEALGYGLVLRLARAGEGPAVWRARLAPRGDTPGEPLEADGPEPGDAAEAALAALRARRA
ncbi:MAG: hypothetical protein R3C15_13620 [Thermoleophilia bacterium]